MSGWSIPMDKFIEKAKADLDAAGRKIVISVYRGVTLDTPVDTGAARGSWQATVGTPATAPNERLDPSGGAVVAEIVAQGAKWKPLSGATFHLTSLCPYMKRLNEGHSKQAPKRFVEMNVMRAGGVVA